MITSILLTIFSVILMGFVFVLPTATLPSYVTATLATVGGYFNLFSWLFPMDTLFLIVALGLTIEGTIQVFRWSVWLYNKIRGSG